MAHNTKPLRRLYTLAAAIGLAIGTMGVAAAATSAAPASPVAPAQVQTGTGGGPSVEGKELENAGDEDTDGVDHQFEGEEVGNNGDGIPDAVDASESATNG